MGLEMLPLKVTFMGGLMETAQKLNVSIKKSFLKGKNTFSSVHRRLRKTRSSLPNTVNRGRSRNIRTPSIEEQVIRRVKENPRLSTRQIALKMQKFVPQLCGRYYTKIYHIQRVQALLPADYASQVIFTQ